MEGCDDLKKKSLACSVMLARGQECTWEGPGWRWWWWRQNSGMDERSPPALTAFVTVFWNVGKALRERASGDCEEGGCVIRLGDLFNSG